VEGVRPVAKPVLYILTRCAVPRTLAEHEAAVLSITPADQSAFVRQTLASLVKAGLLRPEDSRAPSRSTSGGEISTVAIMTAGRPHRLKRCLASLLSNLGDTPRVSVLVIDSSVASDVVSMNQGVISELIDRFGRHIEYLGPTQCEQLCQLLVASGTSQTLVHYAMGVTQRGLSLGGAKNVMSLATAGERVLVLDDDVVCTLWRPQASEAHRLRLCGHNDPRSYRFFASRSEAVPSESISAADLLDAHERVVGRSLTELVEDAGSCDITSACHHLLSASAEGNMRTRVRISMSGIAGDALEPAHRLLLTDGAWKAEFESSREAFEIAMTCNETRRIAAVDSLVHDAACELVASAIDNADTTPPFLPVGRDSGRLFGALLRMCDPQAVFAHVPLGVALDPEVASHSSAASASAGAQVLASDVVLEVLSRSAIPTWESDACNRMQWIGRHVSALGQLSRRDFDEVIKSLVVERRARELLKVESIQDAGPAYPSYWTAALMRYRAATIEALAEPAYYCPADISAPSDSTSQSEWQSALADFGDLLRAWPEMWGAAARLKVRDQLPMRSVL